METKKRWGLKAKEIKIIPGHTFSPEEIEARAFKIEPVEYKGRVIKLVSVESKIQYTTDRTDFVPADWTKQVSDAMRDTSLVFVTHFPPELERTFYNSRFFGEYARSFGEQQIHGIYQKVADLAAEQAKPVAVCDIGNRPTYQLYEYNVPSRVTRFMQTSAYDVEISKSEKFIPQAVDARRMFAVEGMKQTVENYPEGSTFMYVAAPAHINRIKEYLTRKPSLADRVRYSLYENILRGLDTSTRIYEHADSGWTLHSNESYLNPWRNPGRRPQGKMAKTRIGARLFPHEVTSRKSRR